MNNRKNIEDFYKLLLKSSALKHPATIDVDTYKNVMRNAEKLFPYDEVGNPDSYREYNQGWQDAVDFIGSQLGVEY